MKTREKKALEAFLVYLLCVSLSLTYKHVMIPGKGCGRFTPFRIVHLNCNMDTNDIRPCSVVKLQGRGYADCAWITELLEFEQQRRLPDLPAKVGAKSVQKALPLGPKTRRNRPHEGRDRFENITGVKLRATNITDQFLSEPIGGNTLKFSYCTFTFL